MMAGTIVPAGTISAMNMPITAGMPTIDGNYTQTGTGIFNLGLGGLGQAPNSGTSTFRGTRCSTARSTFP